MTAPTPTWRQLPAPLTVHARWPWVLGAWLLAAVPMVSQLRDLGHSDASIWRAVAVTLLGLGIASHRPRWSIPALALTAVAVVTDRSVPPVTLLLLVALAALWGVVTPALDVPLLRRRRGAGSVVAGALLVVAAAVLFVRTGVRLPLAIAVLAAVAVAVETVAPVRARSGRFAPVIGPARRFAAANVALMDRIGRPIGIAVGFVAMLPSALVVVVPWIAQRIVGLDVLAAPSPAWTHWVEREGGDPDAARSFAAPTVRRPHRRQGVRRSLAALIALAIVALPVAAGVAAAQRSDDVAAPIAPVAADDPCHHPAPNPVLDDQPDAAELGCELKAFVSHPRFQALTVFDYPDRSGAWVNQKDGIRSTWTPPACTCRRVKVWWFGGSAAWGWDQRDEFTIPSQIAKRAWKEGIALDIVNYAMPAWVLSQEVQRFELLSMTEPLPDLVLFYDGGNELNRQKERDGRGEGTDESETSFLETELDHYLWRGLSTTDPAALDGPTSRTPGPRITPEQIAEHALNRYSKWVDYARRSMGPLGLDPIFMWQPLMQSAPAVAARPGGVPEIDIPIWKRMVPEAVRRLPAGVIDLSDALDGVDRPVFDDFYHTNELAADIVAASVLDAIGPRLAVLQEPSR